MLIKMVRYLIENPNVLQLVKNGEACLIGVTETEQQALIEVLDLHRLAQTKANPYDSIPDKTQILLLH